MLTHLDYLYGLVLPGATINSLTDCTPAANLAALQVYAGGSPLPTMQAGFGAAPAIEFTTPQVHTILGLCGLGGADLSGGNCDLYYRRSTHLAGRAAMSSAVHLRLRAVRALLYWTEISARGKEPATIRCRLVPTFDGSNPPLVPAAGATIPAAAPAVEVYGLGRCSINGAAVAGVDGWTLSLNPRLVERPDSGEDFPVFAAVENHNPALSIDTPDLDQWAAAGVTGAALNGTTGAVAYLQKRRADTGGGYAWDTQNHIRLTGLYGLASIGQGRGGDKGPASLALQVAFRVNNLTAAHALTVERDVAIT